MVVTSEICRIRNTKIIPQLLRAYGIERGNDEIDLSTAENYFMKNAIADAGHAMVLMERDLDYIEDIGGSRRLRQRIAHLFQVHISPGVTVSPSEVVVGAGASFVLDALIEAICDPGDGVLIATPYWSGLDLSITIRNRARIVPVNVPLDEFFDVTSISYYKRALQRCAHPVKAVLICNPHNPLGRCYPRETLEEMTKFCEDHSLHYISDEVYALSIHGDSPNRIFSVFSLDGKADCRHVVYSLSKDFGCNGVRVGALISRNEHVRMSVALTTHAQMSSLAVLFANDILSNDVITSNVLQQSRKWLHDGYTTVSTFCERHNLSYISATAGLFVFVRLYSGVGGIEEAVFEGKLRRLGLVLTNGKDYHFQQEGWFRICFGIEASRLQVALDRLDTFLDYNLSDHMQRAQQEISEGLLQGPKAL